MCVCVCVCVCVKHFKLTHTPFHFEEIYVSCLRIWTFNTLNCESCERGKHHRVHFSCCQQNFKNTPFLLCIQMFENLLKFHMLKEQEGLRPLLMFVPN